MKGYKVYAIDFFCVKQSRQHYLSHMQDKCQVTKGNPPTLLVGIQIGTTILENSMEILKDLKVELSYEPVIPLLGLCVWRKLYTGKINATQCS